MQADAGVNGEIFAQFSQPFDNFVVPPGQQVHSGTFGNVLLTQGVIASLDIIPLGFLDVASAVTVRIGQGGYEVPFLKLSQSDVPTQYTLALDDISLNSLKGKASISATAAGKSAAAASASTSAGAGSKSEIPLLQTTTRAKSSPSPTGASNSPTIPSLLPSLR